MSTKVLLAEPDPSFARKVGAALEEAGYRASIVATAGETLEAVSKGGFAVLVADVRLLDTGEVPILPFMASRNPNSQVVVTFDAGQAGEALRATRQGASLSLLKPYQPADLLTILGKLKGVFEREESLPAEGEDAPFLYHGMVGKSPALRRVLRLAAKVAPTDSTVLITGETGTGKELVARIIRALSPRAGGPFVTLNCGAIPEKLVESELFGHKRGAFTDAVADRKGLMEAANHGTILLDEIGELPLAAQVKLLRAIEQLEVTRVGDTTPIRVDVRVLASTNRNLAAEVKAGRFREDLYFRLNVVEVHVPPLRERREDVLVLLRYFLNEANRRFGRTVVGVAPSALAVIANYDFPGNVRELRNVAEHAVVMADGENIRMEDLPAHVIAGSTRNRLLESDSSGSHAAPPSAAAPEAKFRFRTLAQAEKELIQETLAKVKNNQTEGAKQLGISRSTLWRKMKEYKLHE